MNSDFDFRKRYDERIVCAFINFGFNVGLTRVQIWRTGSLCILCLFLYVCFVLYFLSNCLAIEIDIFDEE